MKTFTSIDFLRKIVKSLINYTGLDLRLSVVNENECHLYYNDPKDPYNIHIPFGLLPNKPYTVEELCNILQYIRRTLIDISVGVFTVKEDELLK